MRMNTQEAVLSAYIVSIGKRPPRDAGQDAAAELCRFANSLNRLNEFACNSGLTERQERRKQNLQTRIKAVLERAGLAVPKNWRSVWKQVVTTFQRVRSKLGWNSIFPVW